MRNKIKKQVPEEHHLPGQRFELDQIVIYRGNRYRVTKILNKHRDSILRSQIKKTADVIFYQLSPTHGCGLYSNPHGWNDVPQSHIKAATSVTLHLGYAPSQYSFDQILRGAQV